MVSYWNFPGGPATLGLAFDGTNLWVANETDGTLTKLRAADGVNLGTVAAGFCPWGVAVGGSISG